jgi:hypothetical protein
MTYTDAKAFQSRLTSVSAQFNKVSMSGKWASLNVQEFLETAKQARLDKLRQIRARPRRRLKGLPALSYSDFKRDASDRPRLYARS